MENYNPKIPENIESVDEETNATKEKNDVEVNTDQETFNPRIPDNVELVHKTSKKESKK